MDPVSYDWYIYMNVFCKLNRSLSMTKTLLLDHRLITGHIKCITSILIHGSD